MSLSENRAAYLLCAMLFWGIVAAWHVRGYRGHAVRDASDRSVSAERAMDRLANLLGDGQPPHPAGSPANARVRERLLAQLEKLGLDVRTVPFTRNKVALHNVVASIAGDRSRRPLLFVTHYDSVDRGPGAADAGSCVVALLETAGVLSRLASESERLRLSREVVFLFTDAEERSRSRGGGRQGARHFAKTRFAKTRFAEKGASGLMSRNPIVMNFDARGSAGPSLMFETTDHNCRLVQRLLPELPRPVHTASSFVTIYRIMPNSTDFTELKEGEVDGLNFGFIGSPHFYHTADDTIANLDPRSVQHHANNALAMAQCFLAIEDDDFASDQDAVFFTLFCRWIICYPESWAIPLALIVLLLQLVGAAGSFRRGANWRDVLFVLLAVAATCLVSSLIGLVITEVHQGLPRSSHGFGKDDHLLFSLLWLLVGMIAAAMFGGRVFRSAESAWVAIWTSWAVAGVAAAIALPGISYIMLCVGIAPAVGGLLPGCRFRWSAVAAAVAGVTLVPLAYDLGVAIGIRRALLLGGLYGVFLSPLYPLLIRVRNDQAKPSSTPR